jgi:hypothetical protein
MHNLGVSMHGQGETSQLGEVRILGLRQVPKLLPELGEILPLFSRRLPVAVEDAFPLDQLSIGQLEVVGRNFEAPFATGEALLFGAMKALGTWRLSA